MPDPTWTPGAGQRECDCHRQRHVVMDVLRLGLRLQPVSTAGQPHGRVLLGYEHLDAVHAAAS
jgi:hypothetical protein